MGSQITLTMSLIFIGLFTIAIMGFATNFANDNNSAVSVTDDAEVNTLYTDIRTNVSNIEEDSEGTYASILETTVEPGSDVAQSTGSFAGGIKGVTDVGKNVIYIPYKKIFGSGEGFAIFFTIFGAIVVFLFGLYLYKTLRGNP